MRYKFANEENPLQVRSRGKSFTCLLMRKILYMFAYGENPLHVCL